MDTLNAISEIEDQKIKGDQYKDFLASAMSSGDIDSCKLFVDHGNGTYCFGIVFMKIDYDDSTRPLIPSTAAVLSESVSLVLSRQLLSIFARTLPQLHPEAQKTTAT